MGLFLAPLLLAILVSGAALVCEIYVQGPVHGRVRVPLPIPARHGTAHTCCCKPVKLPSRHPVASLYRRPGVLLAARAYSTAHPTTICYARPPPSLAVT